MNDAALHVPAATPPSGQPVAAAERPRLRLWPGLLIVGLLLAAITVPGWVAPGTMTQFLGMFWGPMVGALGLLLWWLFASRLGWTDRLLVVLIALGGGTATWLLSHPSFGFFGLILLGIPLAASVWVGWLLVTPFLSWPVRRAGLVLALLLAWGYCLTLRVDGADGSFAMQRSWRWSPTAEERFLAERPSDQAGSREPVAAVALGPEDWPGFRGPERDGRRPGIRIATDWNTHPPRQVWRRRVGPGWSSFAVAGDRLYTQEQRGPDEAVVCYRASTGEELWAHLDPARFTELVSGVGPRATPTLHDGKVFVLGAAGKLSCLDAATGRSLWTRDITEDSSATVPTWGFASSPLVVGKVVMVCPGSSDARAVLGYDAASGEPLWASGEGAHSYCSPQRCRLDGIDQVLIATEKGLTALAPEGGQVLWQHGWPTPSGLARVVQPAVVAESDVLLGTGLGGGTRRLRLERTDGKWSEQELWTTKAISPYYNDSVVHDGHLYGFDGAFFTCVRLEDGKGRWRVRGYGNGQVLLLPDQDLLLVLSEQGEAVLVDASPDKHNPRARFQAIEGKTWNHPVVAHGKLFIRNGAEAACFDLAPARTGSTGE